MRSNLCCTVLRCRWPAAAAVSACGAQSPVRFTHPRQRYCRHLTAQRRRRPRPNFNLVSLPLLQLTAAALNRLQGMPVGHLAHTTKNPPTRLASRPRSPPSSFATAPTLLDQGPACGSQAERGHGANSSGGAAAAAAAARPTTRPAGLSAGNSRGALLSTAATEHCCVGY